MPIIGYSESDRIQKIKNKIIYQDYLNQNKIQSGSDSTNQDSARIEILVGSILTNCPCRTDTGTDTGSGTGSGSGTDTGIITTDLLIHFEANDLTSYSGSGTIWVNIGTGGTDYNATLAGGDEENIALPIFVDDTIKSFQFTQSFLDGGYSYLNNNYMYFTRPDAISDDFTWCAWINTTQVGYDYNHFQLMYVVSTETGGVNNDFGFGIDAGGYLAYGDGKTGGTDITFSSEQVVNTGTWTFVSVTREKATGNVVLYINGVADATATCNSGNTLSVAPYVLIGSETDFPGFTFGGNLGAVLGNTSVLAADQILQNFNAQRATYGV